MESKMKRKIVSVVKFSLDPVGAFMQGLWKGWLDGFKLLARIIIGIVVLVLSHSILGSITQIDKEKNMISLALFLIVVLGGIWKITPSVMLGILSMSIIWVETEGIIITAILGILTRLAWYWEEEREASLRKTMEGIDGRLKKIEKVFQEKNGSEKQITEKREK